MANTEPVPQILAHPAFIALFAIARVQREGGDLDGPDLFDALCARAEEVGVKPLSAEFDRAAEYAGFAYCRGLDVYCDPELRDEIARRPFAHMPLLP